MRFVELFAGAGGLSLGLEMAGHVCVAHAEIEPHARAVLRHRWPDVPLYGDVAQLTGAALAAAHGPIDLLSGGSPCQDLSVAGLRTGLGGDRSGLFHEQIRLWREIQDAQPDRPVTLLWENVPGALSSQDGRDFATVLSTIVGAAVPVPEKWGRSGVAAGDTAVAAWRVLDARFFGVPQRRARVFVVGVGAGGADPAEILALGEGMCGDSGASGQAGEGAAGGAEGGAGECYPLLEVGARTGVSTTAPRAGMGIGGPADPMFTLQAGKQHGLSMAFKPSHYTRGKDGAPSAVMPPLSADADRGDQEAIVVVVGVDLAPTLGARDYKGPGNFQDGALQATIVQPVAGSVGCGQAGGFRTTDLDNSGAVPVVAGRPRRLMPVECERLQGWPGGHTATGTREDGTTYALSDTARYQLCGNGVASPCAAWIGWQLAGAEPARVTPFYGASHRAREGRRMSRRHNATTGPGTPRSPASQRRTVRSSERISAAKARALPVVASMASRRRSGLAMSTQSNRWGIGVATATLRALVRPQACLDFGGVRLHAGETFRGHRRERLSDNLGRARIGCVQFLGAWHPFARTIESTHHSILRCRVGLDCPDHTRKLGPMALVRNSRKSVTLGDAA